MVWAEIFKIIVFELSPVGEHHLPGTIYKPKCRNGLSIRMVSPMKKLLAGIIGCLSPRPLA
jgi:hypothetical protein